jgi:probable HAF family extracellular repeat protein
MFTQKVTAIRRSGIAAGAALALAALAATPAAADPPPAGAGTTAHGFLFKRGELTAIDHPRATTVPAAPNGQAGTSTTGINDRGETLGAYEGRDRVVRHFLRDRKGRFTGVDGPRSLPPGQSDELVDINNRDQIVGYYNDDQGATTTGFLRTRKGRFVDIEVPGSQVTGPLKINDRRQVVGLYLDADAQPNPDGSVPPGAFHGFVWDDGEYETIDVPGAAATFVLGISDRGRMVGSYIDADGAYHGFLRTRKGAVRTLPEAPGAVPEMGGTQPAAVNDRGQIVGLAYEADGGSSAFLFEDGAFRSIDGPDAVYTRALDINSRGQIVGEYGTKPPAAARALTARQAGSAPGLQTGVEGGRIWLP